MRCTNAHTHSASWHAPPPHTHTHLVQELSVVRHNDHGDLLLLQVACAMPRVWVMGVGWGVGAGRLEPSRARLELSQSQPPPQPPHGPAAAPRSGGAHPPATRWRRGPGGWWAHPAAAGLGPAQGRSRREQEQEVCVVGRAAGRPQAAEQITADLPPSARRECTQATPAPHTAHRSAPHLEQDFAQAHAHLPAAAVAGHQSVVVVGAKPQLWHHLRRVVSQRGWVRGWVKG